MVVAIIFVLQALCCTFAEAPMPSDYSPYYPLVLIVACITAALVVWASPRADDRIGFAFAIAGVVIALASIVVALIL